MRIKQAVWKVYINWSSVFFLLAGISSPWSWFRLLYVRRFHSRSEGRVRERVRLHVCACMEHTQIRIHTRLHLLFYLQRLCICFCFINQVSKLLLLSSTHSKIMNISCAYKEIKKRTEIRQLNNGNLIYEFIRFYLRKNKREWAKNGDVHYTVAFRR